ncbi:MAG TPA: hypothetical protein VD932_06525 [Aquabacterium sp.]|nr:hypothetical protein [Aquabacterium sp.]
MHIVAVAWLFVVVLMTLAEATSPVGTLLGAFFTLLLYGLLPLAVVLYVMGTPMRRRARLQAEAAALAQGPPGPPAPAAATVAARAAAGDSAAAGQAGRQPARDPVAPEREKP